MTETQSNPVALTETVQIPWNKLRPSRHNVRVAKSNNGADEALAANIAQVGILENLIVAPSENEEGLFEVHAGGRRYRAVGANIKAGVFEESYLLPCRIQESGNQTAISLAENLHAPMHPADEFIAFKLMVDEGLNRDDIARHFGVTVQRVAQRLKLAKVASQIITAYRSGNINLDTVIAFTLCDSKKRQLEVFKQLGTHCFEHNVREAFAGGSMRSDDRLAAFVGEAAYVEAGGAVLNDMFSEFDYFQDDELVRELATAKLQSAAAKISEDEGWANVEVEIESYYRHDLVTVEPVLVGDHHQISAKLKETIETQNAMDQWDNDWGEEDEKRFDELTQEIESLESVLDSYREYTDEQKAAGLCIVSVSNNGKVKIERGLMPRKSLKTKQSNDAGEAKPSLSMALREDLGVHRQQIAKAALLQEPELVSDLLLYSLCYPLLSESRWETKALDASYERVMPDGIDEHSDSSAGKALAKAEKRLSVAWVKLDTAPERFAALRKLTAKRKQALQSYCAALVFKTRLFSEADCITEAVLAEVQPDYAEYWRPSAKAFFNRVSGGYLRDTFEPLLGEGWFAARQASTKKAMVGVLEVVFNGPARSLTEAELDVRENWLPPGFNPE